MSQKCTRSFPRSIFSHRPHNFNDSLRHHQSAAAPLLTQQMSGRAGNLPRELTAKQYSWVGCACVSWTQPIRPFNVITETHFAKQWGEKDGRMKPSSVR